ncbi:hypothetical protein Gbem_0819 [Citrifermentans bemidjiense Bem]|uniref:Glycine-rich protein n=1 Tax=Citrifermentans bemidjiense (strain ATCC BAA-1014 / DSM 16622 / JCM 12645 / Bem) TaxID=404380 RepID=B5EEU6_CITBB|nr:hypothetical protein [Citrifermentans bemidjiense]ACH37842.1 hypothetical protein Gbem_0819 [Citrifermentans bemidjiense Bem]
MKVIKMRALIIPMLVAAWSVLSAAEVSYADRGGGGGGEQVARAAGRSGGTSYGGRGGYVGRGGYTGRGGYSGGGYGTRYLGPSHSYSHFSGSVWIGPGFGFWDPWYYPYYQYPSYRYYAPPTVVVPQEPQEYVLPESQQETGYWYYCRNPQGYYPYVERCPSGWMKVVPDTVPPGEEQQDKEK